MLLSTDSQKPLKVIQSKHILTLHFPANFLADTIHQYNFYLSHLHLSFTDNIHFDVKQTHRFRHIWNVCKNCLCTCLWNSMKIKHFLCMYVLHDTLCIFGTRLMRCDEHARHTDFFDFQLWFFIAQSKSINAKVELKK